MAIRVPNPYESPASWSKIVFVTPGKNSERYEINGEITVSAKASVAIIDEQTVPGLNGTFRVVQGYSDATADVQIALFEGKDIERMQQLMDAVNGQLRTAPQVLSVLHPNLTLARLRQCFIKDVTYEDFTLEDGLVIKFGLAAVTDTIDQKKLAQLKKSIKSSNGVDNDGSSSVGTNTGGKTTSGTPRDGIKQPPSKDNPQTFMPGPLGQVVNKLFEGERAGSNKASGK